MTSVRKLKIVSGAGEADECLALRVDVLAAVGKLDEAYNEAMRRPTLGRFELIDDQVTTLLMKYKRYLRACRKRKV